MIYYENPAVAVIAAGGSSGYFLLDDIFIIENAVEQPLAAAVMARLVEMFIYRNIELDGGVAFTFNYLGDPTIFLHTETATIPEFTTLSAISLFIATLLMTVARRVSRKQHGQKD
jgi:hypothetical protein